LADEILTGLERWKKSDQWTRESGRFVPAALVWLNQDRWAAELDAPESEFEFVPATDADAALVDWDSGDPKAGPRP
jgi:hypothetical protein